MGSHLVVMISSTLVLVYPHVLCFGNKILLRFVRSIPVLDGDEFTVADKAVPGCMQGVVFLDSWAGSDDVVTIRR